MSDPSGLPPHPYRRHWTDYASTFIALVVSVISLWVAIATEKANQKMVDANYQMVAASSWPFLQLDSGNDDEGQHRITMEIDNAGVGPAKLQSFEVFWRGKAYGSSFALLQACCAPGRKLIKMGTAPVQGIVLRAGDRRQFLRLDRDPEDPQIWMAFDEVRLGELSYRACYCSVFDECWISELNASPPHRVKVCPKPATPFNH